jgi:hypothetical protein
VITDQTILDTVPQAGAERAAAVFLMMKDKGSVIAAARAILAYAEWLAEQSCEMQMGIAIDTAKTVKGIREARAKYRREASK